MIAYRFPPQGGGGVQRIVKFVKYLPERGWLPVVHTVSNPYWPLRDATLLREIPPGVAVHRTPTFEFEQLGRSAETPRPGREDRAGDSDDGRAGRRRGDRRGRVVRALGHFVLRHVLIPDPQIAWLPFAFVRSVYLIRKERAALIYSSSPPNSGQLLAWLLKRVVHRPWIADFRDPWTEGIRRKQAYEQSPIRRRLEAAFERAVITGADHVVVTTEKTREQFIAKYPAVAPEKFSVIPNGFDPADFALPSSGPRLLGDGEFNLTLTGNVEAMFDAAPFFDAVKELIEEEDAIRDHLRVNFIGTKRGKYDAYLRANGLETHVRYVGYVPHATSLRYLAESDVLFLCQIPVYESASTKLSGKLFEYLYMRKPILALTLPGLTSEILARSGLGVTVEPGDQAGIKAAIRRLHEQWRHGHRAPAADEQYIARFDRVRQAERLGGLFDQLAGRSA